ncbi:hypothetical protein CYMTET_18160 [Cymbomonas tetramitiformis]|uniref:Uncharacterized protein n=1 Tax=Cymbomonas tetramitiformis TaxID=36881 RepID=A0AAE0G8P5_9CHLO|nr:hypothetical protein CYMTET_18160 [Cymbomonas tetramitiformis]
MHAGRSTDRRSAAQTGGARHNQAERGTDRRGAAQTGGARHRQARRHTDRRGAAQTGGARQDRRSAAQTGGRGTDGRGGAQHSQAGRGRGTAARHRQAGRHRPECAAEGTGGMSLDDLPAEFSDSSEEDEESMHRRAHMSQVALFAKTVVSADMYTRFSEPLQDLAVFDEISELYDVAVAPPRPSMALQEADIVKPAIVKMRRLRRRATAKTPFTSEEDAQYNAMRADLQELEEVVRTKVDHIMEHGSRTVESEVLSSEADMYLSLDDPEEPAPSSGQPLTPGGSAERKARLTRGSSGKSGKGQRRPARLTTEESSDRPESPGDLYAEHMNSMFGNYFTGAEEGSSGSSDESIIAVARRRGAVLRKPRPPRDTDDVSSLDEASDEDKERSPSPPAEDPTVHESPVGEDSMPEENMTSQASKLSDAEQASVSQELSFPSARVPHEILEKDYDLMMELESSKSDMDGWSDHMSEPVEEKKPNAAKVAVATMRSVKRFSRTLRCAPLSNCPIPEKARKKAATLRTTRNMGIFGADAMVHTRVEAKEREVKQHEERERVPSMFDRSAQRDYDLPPEIDNILEPDRRSELPSTFDVPDGDIDAFKAGMMDADMGIMETLIDIERGKEEVIQREREAAMNQERTADAESRERQERDRLEAEQAGKAPPKKAKPGARQGHILDYRLGQLSGTEVRYGLDGKVIHDTHLPAHPSKYGIFESLEDWQLQEVLRMLGVDCSQANDREELVKQLKELPYEEAWRLHDRCYQGLVTAYDSSAKELLTRVCDEPAEAKRAFDAQVAYVKQDALSHHEKAELQRQLDNLAWLSLPHALTRAKHPPYPEVDPQLVEDAKKYMYIGSHRPYDELPNSHLLPTIAPPVVAKNDTHYAEAVWGEQPLAIISSMKLHKRPVVELPEGEMHTGGSLIHKALNTNREEVLARELKSLEVATAPVVRSGGLPKNPPLYGTSGFLTRLGLVQSDNGPTVGAVGDVLNNLASKNEKMRRATAIHHARTTAKAGKVVKKKAQGGQSGTSTRATTVSPQRGGTEVARAAESSSRKVASGVPKSPPGLPFTPEVHVVPHALQESERPLGGGPFAAYISSASKPPSAIQRRHSADKHARPKEGSESPDDLVNESSWTLGRETVPSAGTLLASMLRSLYDAHQDAAMGFEEMSELDVHADGMSVFLVSAQMPPYNCQT